MIYPSSMKRLNLAPCEPPVWARGGHRQTILGHLLPSPRLASKGERVILSHADGDRAVAYVLRGTSKTVVYLFHGLTGSVDSAYIQRMARIARKHDHTVIMMNHRGCGEGAGLARHPYHSGRAEDLSTAIKWGREQFPKARHVAIGYSLSANALLLLMGGGRGDVQPDAAIAVNGPIDLASCSRTLHVGLNRIYDLKFVAECQRELKQRRLTEKERRDYRVPPWSTLYHFDSVYTAPAGGFQSREHYYETCSAEPWLAKIEKPTIVLTAADDPFVVVEAYRRAQSSSAVQMHIEETGGHMGYLSQGPKLVERWLDRALEQALAALTDA